MPDPAHRSGPGLRHPRVVQARLGHKSIVETMDTYGHLLPDANEETTRARDAHNRAALLRRSHGA